MSSRKQNLRVVGAFGALATLALLVSCTGFFVNPTWQSIAIQPPSPAVAVGFTITLTAWGTDTNGQRSQITHNLVWDVSAGSGSGTVATLDPNTGILTGVSPGTVTVTASSEGVSGTATATVAQEVSTMTITPLTEPVTDDGTSFATFTVTSGGTNISSLVTLTASQGGQNITQITCGYQADATDGMQDCKPDSGLVAAGTSQQYLITVTYAGYTGTTPVTATLTVNGPQ
jgi:Bacterial Ig-like domain (group 2)